MLCRTATANTTASLAGAALLALKSPLRGHALEYRCALIPGEFCPFGDTAALIVGGWVGLPAGIAALFGAQIARAIRALGLLILMMSTLPFLAAMLIGTGPQSRYLFLVPVFVLP